MFLSEYSHNMDTKGRVALPAEFREQLGEECVVAAGFDICLTVYPLEYWEKVVEKLMDLPPFSIDARKVQRNIIKNAKHLTFDKQGRILIPKNLRDYAFIQKEVKVIGVGRRIEIWDKQKLDEQQLSAEEFSNLAESLDLPADFTL